MAVDWLSIAFYAVALAEIVVWVVSWVGGENISFQTSLTLRPWNGDSSPGKYHYLGVLLPVVLVGLALPLSERLIPQRYTDDKAHALLSISQADDALLSEQERAEIENMLSAGMGVWYGRALYPRYYAAGKGMEGWKNGYKYDFSRYEFYLVGTTHRWVTLPYLTPDDEFPHGVDVVLIGCGREKYLEAMVLMLYSPESGGLQSVLWRDSAATDRDDCYALSK